MNLTPIFLALLVAAAPERAFEPMDVFQLEWASDARISPDGSEVVYVRNSMDIMEDRSRGELWIVGSDGSDHRRLGPGSEPRWSPDGARLAYVDDSQIHVRWMDSGQSARLTQLTESPRHVTWSPDGREIAFSMLVREDAPKLASLPEKPEGASWADPPIVVTRLRNRADGRGYLDHGYQHLFVVPAEGGTPRQVTSDSFHHGARPVWTPDGEALVFSANRSEDWEHEFQNSEIYRVSLDDGAIVALTDRDGPDERPTVSPDGSRIAYLGHEDRVRTYQVTKLHVMNADGSGKCVITEAMDRSVGRPVWAPDGRGVLFQYDDQGNTKVAHVNLDGEVRVLAGDMGGASYGVLTGAGRSRCRTTGGSRSP